MRRTFTLIALLAVAAANVSAANRTQALLARAWPHDPHAPLSELGRGVGVVFSPDLSVPGNCLFYESLGFACFEDTDWSRVLAAVAARNADPARAIRTLILETHGTNGNGLKLQESYAPAAERSYIAVGALQEHAEALGIDYVIISACNSGRLLRPAIYTKLDPNNGDRLFLPATCGIIDASPSWSARKSVVTIITPASSHIETTVVGDVRELSPAAQRLIIESANARGLTPPTEFAVSDIFSEIVTRDPALALTTNAHVDALSRTTADDAESDRLFDRFVAAINARAEVLERGIRTR